MASAKSIGGVITESLSESFFCIYLSLRMKVGKNKFSEKCKGLVISVSQKDPEIGLKNFCTTNKIQNLIKNQLTDSEFIGKKNLWKDFLVFHGWNEKMMMMCETFIEKSKINQTGNYYPMRTRVLEDSYNPYIIYKKFAEKMKQALQFSKALGDDKWNPSDVWIFNQKGINSLKKFKTTITTKKKENITVKEMDALGKLIQSEFEKKNIFPVSLKAPTKTVHYTLINYIAKNKKDQITETFQFAGVQKMKDIFTMNNRDVKIPFKHIIKHGQKIVETNEGNIKLKAFSSGSYRFEIEYKGAGAKGGSIGTENWQFLISKTDRTGINKMKRIRSETTPVPENNKKPVWNKKGAIVEAGGSLDTNWFGGLTYARLPNKEKLALVPLLKNLCKEISATLKVTNTNDSTFVLDKTSSAEIAVSVLYMKNDSARNDAVNSMFNLASSRKFGYASYGSSAKGKLTTLMNSCFHIKLH